MNLVLCRSISPSNFMLPELSPDADKHTLCTPCDVNKKDVDVQTDMLGCSTPGRNKYIGYGEVA